MGQQKTKIKSQLTNDDISFLMKQTGLRRGEINQNFKRYVVNGKISLEMFKRLYTFLLSAKIEDADKCCERIFYAFNKRTNNDFFTLSEFLTIFAITTTKNRTKRLEYTFDLFDSNKSGSITFKEATPIMSCFIDVASRGTNCDVHEMAKEFFWRLDVNSDNIISKEEFVKELSRNFFLRSVLAPL